jgi:hypothetical protein
MTEPAWAEWQEALLDLHAAVDANEDSAMLSFREWCHDHTLERSFRAQGYASKLDR